MKTPLPLEKQTNKQKKAQCQLAKWWQGCECWKGSLQWPWTQHLNHAEADIHSGCTTKLWLKRGSLLFIFFILKAGVLWFDTHSADHMHTQHKHQWRSHGSNTIMAKRPPFVILFFNLHTVESEQQIIKAEKNSFKKSHFNQFFFFFFFFKSTTRSLVEMPQKCISKKVVHFTFATSTCNVHDFHFEVLFFFFSLCPGLIMEVLLSKRRSGRWWPEYLPAKMPMIK